VLNRSGLDRRVSYALTEKAESALRHPAFADTSEEELKDINRQDKIRRAVLSGETQAELEQDLLELQKAFPQFTIWFSKISVTTTVWCAQNANGSVQRNSAADLRTALSRLVRR
jgi:hypothetical protein